VLFESTTAVVRDGSNPALLRPEKCVDLRSGYHDGLDQLLDALES
jgi:hypothetical protein